MGGFFIHNSLTSMGAVPPIELGEDAIAPPVEQMNCVKHTFLEEADQPDRIAQWLRGHVLPAVGFCCQSRAGRVLPVTEQSKLGCLWYKVLFRKFLCQETDVPERISRVRLHENAFGRNAPL